MKVDKFMVGIFVLIVVTEVVGYVGIRRKIDQKMQEAHRTVNVPVDSTAGWPTAGCGYIGKEYFCWISKTTTSLVLGAQPKDKVDIGQPLTQSFKPSVKIEEFKVPAASNNNHGK